MVQLLTDPGAAHFEEDDPWDIAEREFEDDDFDTYQTMDSRPYEVEPGLFIGSFLAEQNKEALKAAGITHVLQVAEGLKATHPDEFQYLRISVQDAPGEDLVAHFPKALPFIEAAIALRRASDSSPSKPKSRPSSATASKGTQEPAPVNNVDVPPTTAVNKEDKRKGGVLVHCVAGISRSATVVIGYLMKQHRISYDDAFRRVHAVRPWVMPNHGFRMQLAEFERLGYDTTNWKAWRHMHPDMYDGGITVPIRLARPPFNVL